MFIKIVKSMYGDLLVKYKDLIALVMQNHAEKVIDLLESDVIDTRIYRHKDSK